MGVINSQYNPDFVDARVVFTDLACLSSVYVGAAVIINSGTISNAIATSMATSNVIGIVEAKPSLNKCTVRVLGVTENDIYTGLDESKEYYLSDAIAGEVTDTPPSASGSIMLKLGQPVDSENMLILKGVRIIRN